MRIFLLFLTLVLYNSSNAQKPGGFTLGLNIRPGEDLLAGGKLAYLRQLVPGHLFGLKASLNTNAHKLPFTDRLVMTNIDLIRRWSLKQYPTSRIWMDAGLSFLQSTYLAPPGQHVYECGMGMNEGDYIAFEKDWYFESDRSPGLALAMGLDFLAGKKRPYFIGFDLTGNLYYKHANENVYLYLNPSLSCSFPMDKSRQKANAPHSINQ